MTQEQREGYERRLATSGKSKYVSMKPEVVARRQPEDKKEYEESLQKNT